MLEEITNKTKKNTQKSVKNSKKKKKHHIYITYTVSNNPSKNLETSQPKTILKNNNKIIKNRPRLFRMKITLYKID